jgi:hypothetical protein
MPTPDKIRPWLHIYCGRWPYCEFTTRAEWAGMRHEHDTGHAMYAGIDAEAEVERLREGIRAVLEERPVQDEEGTLIAVPWRDRLRGLLNA